MVRIVGRRVTGKGKRIPAAASPSTGRAVDYDSLDFATFVEKKIDNQSKPVQVFQLA